MEERGYAEKEFGDPGADIKKKYYSSFMVCSVFFVIDFLAITQVKRLLHKTKNLDVPREILCPKDTRFTISIHFEIVSFLVLFFGL